MELVITEKLSTGNKNLSTGKSGKSVKGSHPAIYIKFRYTLQQGADRNNAISEANCMSALLFANASILTVGFEEKDSLGKPTHPHIHFHMLINDLIPNLRGRFKTLMKKNEEEREGNELYSLKQAADVIDANRFFRYPWKQGGRIKHCEKIENLSDFDIPVEIKCAQEEYSRTIQFNNDKVDRSTRANTYDKIVALFKADPPTSLGVIMPRIVNFYVSEGLACNDASYWPDKKHIRLQNDLY